MNKITTDKAFKGVFYGSNDKFEDYYIIDKSFQGCFFYSSNEQGYYMIDREKHPQEPSLYYLCGLGK